MGKSAHGEGLFARRAYLDRAEIEECRDDAGNRDLYVLESLKPEAARGAENNRALMGGGRYDNLTEMFGGEPVTGIGFGMGDVTMRDFLETHDLLTADITAPTIMIIPTDEDKNIEAQRLAQAFRRADIHTAVDLGTKKIGKKLAAAGEAFVEFALILGEDEVKSEIYSLKNLNDGSETKGTLEELIQSIA